MSSPFARQVVRRIIAAANAVGLVLTALLTFRAFAVEPPHGLRASAVLVLALPWCIAPWVIFAVTWWRSEGWRLAAQERPGLVATDAWIFATTNAFAALVLVPYAVEPHWLNHAVLPLYQYGALTVLRVVLSVLARLVR